MDKEVWKEKIKNWYKEHSDKLRKDEERIDEMTSNEEYINWLCNYIKENHYFCDEDWMYFPDTMEENDRINASKMCLLYQIIDQYAINHNIDPTDSSFGNFYRVNYYDFKFNIGVRLDNGVMFYCNEDIDEDKEFIDFNGILDVKRKDKVLIK